MFIYLKIDNTLRYIFQRNVSQLQY